jgi:hypothetical protein
MYFLEEREAYRVNIGGHSLVTYLWYGAIYYYEDIYLELDWVF